MARWRRQSKCARAHAGQKDKQNLPFKFSFLSGVMMRGSPQARKSPAGRISPRNFLRTPS